MLSHLWLGDSDHWWRWTHCQKVPAAHRPLGWPKRVTEAAELSPGRQPRAGSVAQSPVATWSPSLKSCVGQRGGDSRLNPPAVGDPCCAARAGAASLLQWGGEDWVSSCPSCFGLGSQGGEAEPGAAQQPRPPSPRSFLPCSRWVLFLLEVKVPQDEAQPPCPWCAASKGAPTPSKGPLEQCPPWTAVVMWSLGTGEMTDGVLGSSPGSAAPLYLLHS